MFRIQKRYAGDTIVPSPHPFLNKLDELPPVDPENVGRTGYGEIRGELRNIMGGPIEELNDFPEGMSKLERGRWYPYSLRSEYPPVITSGPEQTTRIWTEMHMEELLDHTPPHEVHASSLPDYHYFPPIVNEADHKLPSEAQTTAQLARRYTEDQTYVPRFFRTGVPKLPRYEQDWYVPRLPSGRFDWKRNIRENGYTASLFDAKGWDRRFLLRLNAPSLPGFHLGARQWAQVATYFRVHEQPLLRRFSRHFVGSQFDTHVIFFSFYFGALVFMSGNAAHWRRLVWENDPFNYDICFASENRKKGGFHGIV